MPKPQKYRDVTKFLRSRGWVCLRNGKGSHEIWGTEDGTMTISIPAHTEVSAGVVKQIIGAFPDAPDNWKR
jgi:predicted RNA binding protein YcfA (HicA-like mRNA interferase family)